MKDKIKKRCGGSYNLPPSLPPSLPGHMSLPRPLSAPSCSASTTRPWPRTGRKPNIESHPGEKKREWEGGREREGEVDDSPTRNGMS